MIEFLPTEDDDDGPRIGTVATLELLNHITGYNTYTSGGGIYNGQHWQTASQAHCNSLGLANLGAQGITPAQLAQQQALALMGARAYYPELEPKPDPLPDAGIRAGEIIGHRAWRIKWSDALLTSMTVNTVWAPGEPMTGEPHCLSMCRGVHAFKSASAVLTEYGCEGPVAIGTVLLWGQVIEHEHGYRAEFGKINSIDLLTNITLRDIPQWRLSWWAGWVRNMPSEHLLNCLRQRYGV